MWRTRQYFLAINARHHDVGPQYVHERQRLVHGHHVGEVEFVDIAEVLKHSRELAGERDDFLVGQVQPSQPGYVTHVGCGDRFRHGWSW